MEKVQTSAALWQDFNPTAEPLDINILKTVEKDGLVTKTLYFTGRVVSDGKTRILAKVCAKSTKGSKPAVLLIDNYKKPIDEEELRYWANNGFVAMAIDYAGRRTKGISTIYPFSLDYCNSDVAKSYFDVGESAKDTKIYEYALGSMRAITYLLQEENVKSVSVVTVKKGVSVGVIVLGTDTRITNGTVVFGSLNREFPEDKESADQSVSELEGEALAHRLEYEEKRQMWMAGIAPQSYAIQSQKPLYIIASANSPHVSFLGINKMYYRLQDQSRMLLLPMTMDYLTEEYTQGIVKWCKGTTVDDVVELQQVEINGCNNFVKIATKMKSSNLTLWYTRNADVRARNWVKAPLKKVEDGYVAELDVYEQTSNILAFVVAKSAIHITTPMCEVKVTNPTKVKIPTRSIYAGNNDDNLVPLAKRAAGWHGEKNAVEYCKGYLDIYGAKGSFLATFAVNDPSVRHREIFTVSFDICCSVQQNLRVYAMANFGFQNTVFTQNAQLIGDGKWQRITLEGIKFHSEDGRQMAEDQTVEMLAFEADSEFIINNIFLV